jgi:hypothetical protein
VLVGLHAGYTLTRLEGRFDDIALENTARHTAFALNGGDCFCFFNDPYVLLKVQYRYLEFFTHIIASER